MLNRIKTNVNGLSLLPLNIDVNELVGYLYSSEPKLACIDDGFIVDFMWSSLNVNFKRYFGKCILQSSRTCLDILDNDILYCVTIYGRWLQNCIYHTVNSMAIQIEIASTLKCCNWSKLGRIRINAAKYSHFLPRFDQLYITLTAKWMSVHIVRFPCCWMSCYTMQFFYLWLAH